jgi:hypothetical protein
MPDKQQVKAALRLYSDAGQSVTTLRGVPVFQAEDLSVKVENEVCFFPDWYWRNCSIVSSFFASHRSYQCSTCTSRERRTNQQVKRSAEVYTGFLFER